MSLNTTALRLDVSPLDTTIDLLDPTGILPGSRVQIGAEYLRVAQGYTRGTRVVPVMRGQDGTMTSTHRAGIPVVTGDAVVDFTVSPAAGVEADRPGTVPLQMFETKDMDTPPYSLVPIAQPTALGLTVLRLERIAGGRYYVLDPPSPELTGAMLLLLNTTESTQIGITNISGIGVSGTRPPGLRYWYTVPARGALLLVAHTEWNFETNAPYAWWYVIGAPGTVQTA